MILVRRAYPTRHASLREAPLPRGHFGDVLGRFRAPHVARRPPWVAARLNPSPQPSRHPTRRASPLRTPRTHRVTAAEVGVEHPRVKLLARNSWPPQWA
jgi:hypothetical protein